MPANGEITGEKQRMVISRKGLLRYLLVANNVR